MAELFFAKADLSKNDLISYDKFVEIAKALSKEEVLVFWYLMTTKEEDAERKRCHGARPQKAG